MWRVILLLVLCLLPTPALAAFGYYTAFTVQSGQVSGASALTDFPVLIKPANADRWKQPATGHVLNASGFDIRPHATATCDSALTYELVVYDATNGSFEMWVKVAALQDDSGTPSIIYICYGDSGLSTDGSDAPNTWSANYAAVYHLGDGATLSVADSRNSFNGTNHNVTASAGKISGGGTGGATQYIDIGAGPNLVGDLTLSAWINTTATAPELIIGGYGSAGYDLGIGVNTAGLISYIGGGAWRNSTNTVNGGTWTAIAVTQSGTAITFYLNGSSNGSTADTAPASNTGTHTLFADTNGTSYPWTGSADEIHISSVPRSADWIATEYANQNAPTSFWSIGTETALSGGTPPTRRRVIIE